APGDFEAEQILPFGPARVKERDLAARRFEQQEAVVLDGHVPEVGGRRAAHTGEIAEEPAREIDQVHALVDQLAAARALGLGSPLAVVAGASAMAVAAADEHQVAESAALEDLACFAKGTVITVIEAHPHEGGGARDAIQFRGAAGARF